MHTLRNLLLSFATFVSWAILAFVLWFTAWILLVPWETTTFLETASGGLQYSTNRFFFSEPVQIGILLLMGFVTALPILRTIMQRWQASFRILLLNTGFIFVGYVGWYWALTMRSAIFLETAPNAPVPYNPTHSIIPFAVLGICYAIWAWQVSKLCSGEKRKNKLKNTERSAAIERLMQRDAQTDTPCDPQESVRLVSTQR